MKRVLTVVIALSAVALLFSSCGTDIATAPEQSEFTSTDGAVAVPFTSTVPTVTLLADTTNLSAIDPPTPPPPPPDSTTVKRTTVGKIKQMYKDGN